MEIAAAKTIVGFAGGVLVVAGLVVTSGCSTIGVGAPASTGVASSTMPATTMPATTMPTKLFPDDLQAACKGATVSRATPYAEGAPTHKVVLFSPYGGHLVEDMSTLPSDWMVQFDANSDAYAQVDTVACLEVKEEQPLKECTGYQDDGHDTRNEVDLRSAVYTVSVREAATGKELGTTELSGTDDTCPMFMSFDDDTQTKIYYAPPSKDDLVAFIKPFVQP
ncbi:MAG: hypothetical protein QOK02_2955 [Mycobacterium sp.]|nr:hypothetical protein [Mycobacterium sp.]